MISLPILPLFLLPLLPADPPTDPPPHPHYQKVTAIAGVKGNVTVSWFTVPYNPEQVANNKKPNYTWSRGFRIKSDVELHFGKVKVPKGEYALAFQLDGEAKNWSIVLTPYDAMRLQYQLRRARRSGGDTAALEAKLAEAKKKGNFTLPTSNFKGTMAEHMVLAATSHGYKCKSRRDPSPISGVSGEIRVSFGDLHVMTKFEEAFTAPKEDGQGERRRRRR